MKLICESISPSNCKCKHNCFRSEYIRAPEFVTMCLVFIFVGTMVNFVALAREHWVNILVPMGFVIGWYLDKQQDQKLTAFRNKSVLFSR